MRLLRIIALAGGLLLVTPIATQAESWRGIVPLRSTKTDVERLLGKPSEATDTILTYRSVNETAFVHLITTDAGNLDVKVFPSGTVEHIQVFPRQMLSLSALGLDEKRIVFVKGTRPEHSGFQGYVDDDAGLIVKTNGTQVEIVFYFANSKDRAACSTCSISLQKLADVPTCVLCPSVMVTCQNDTDAFGRAMFTVSVSVGYPAPKLTFDWTVDAGIIVAGQGTDTITVNARQVKGLSTTATVIVGGMDAYPACTNTASCTTQIVKRTRP
jgi:hypothetical protein